VTAAAVHIRRLFFALWPDDATREALRRSTRDVMRHCGGKPVRLERYHITLAFLGNVPDEQFDAVVGAAGGVTLEPVTLTLDRYGYFPAAQVLWLGPAQTPHGLRALSRDLRAAMAGAGVSADTKPFNAHLTLARKVRNEPDLAPPRPVAWPVGGFVLVESDTDPEGARYQVVASFPVGGASAPI
jgi:2'-5' RNA ligase